MKATSSRRLSIELAEACDRGLVRADNQDSVLQAEVPLGQLLVVADGIGGYEGGAVASRMVVDSFHEFMAGVPAHSRPDEAIRAAATKANAAVLAAAMAPDSRYRQMGSTVVMAIVRSDQNGTTAWIGHIGDSRAYLLRGGRLNRITTDHSAVQVLLSRNLITPEEAANHPDASVLVRSIGQESEVEIDIDMVTLEAGDTLLLCSDGLWGYVDELAIEAATAQPATMGIVAAALLQLALDAGGRDNIGIELARFAAAPAKAHKKLRFWPVGKKGYLQMLAIGLLVIAVLGALAYLAWRQHWI